MRHGAVGGMEAIEMNKLMKSCTEHAKGIERLIPNPVIGARKWNRENGSADKAIQIHDPQPAIKMGIIELSK